MNIVACDIRIHFIGIGGIGMSGMAEILLQYGFSITGSDQVLSRATDRLEELGAKIFKGHDGRHLEGVGLVVYSSSIREDNPEYQQALKNNIPLMGRSEMVAELMRLKKGVAITGSHGKTTTTSLVSSILYEGGLDPTCLIGGVAKNLKAHVRIGGGEYLVVEADESDGKFLKYNHVYSIITNIDNDHLDYYHSMEELKKAFLQFINNTSFYGRAFVNIDDPVIRSLAGDIQRPWSSYSLHQRANFQAKDIDCSGSTSFYTLVANGKHEYPVALNLPGHHNVSHSVAAFAMGLQLGLAPEEILKSFKTFQGIERRFEIFHQWPGGTIINDYAHHPTEVIRCLETARAIYPGKNLVAIFEPHRYSRAQQCWGQFLHSFNVADELYLLPIYPAGSPPIPGICSEALIRDINQLHPNLGQFSPSLSMAMEKIQKDSVIICMGAGSIGRDLQQWKENLRA